MSRRDDERKIKIDYILKTFPEVMTIDPLFSYSKIDDIRKKMLEDGIYKSRQSQELINNAIINYVKEIQTGKFVNIKPNRKQESTVASRMADNEVYL